MLQKVVLPVAENWNSPWSWFSSDYLYATKRLNWMAWNRYQLQQIWSHLLLSEKHDTASTWRGVSWCEHRAPSQGSCKSALTAQISLNLQIACMQPSPSSSRQTTEWALIWTIWIQNFSRHQERIIGKFFLKKIDVDTSYNLNKPSWHQVWDQWQNSLILPLFFLFEIK